MDKVGKYLILGKLGQGGMGVVYRALDPLLERVVALKTISAHLDSQPDLRARFFREGRSAAHLSHKNIITIYDIGEDNGVAYLAMEYLEGEDLKAKIARRMNVPVQRKLGIIMEVCQGLSHAHSRHVIHRDIKPANIFMSNSGEIKILDFGLARMVAADITRTGAPLGTPNYMSPEQVRGEKVDHRADIFSVGAVFYELLALRRAFDEDSVPATILKILQYDPEPLEKIDPSIDPALAATVMRALAKDPDARFQTVQELLAELRGFAASLPPAPEPEDTDALTSGTGRSWTGELLDLPTIETPVGATPGQVSPAGRHSAGSVFTVPTTPVPAFDSGKPAEPLKPLLADTTTSQSRPAGRQRVLGWAAAVLLLLVVSSALWLRRAPEPAAVAARETNTSSGEASADPGASHSASRQGQVAERSPAAEAVVPPPAPLPAPPEPAEPQIRQSAKNPEPPSRETGTAEVFRPERKAPEAAAPDPRVVQAQLNAAARSAADEAMQQMIRARTRADGAGAAEYAAKSYEAAHRVELEAKTLYDSGQFQKAGPRLYETSGLYASAAIEAEAEKESRARQAEERRLTLLRSQAESRRQAFEQAHQAAVSAGAQQKDSGKFQEASKLAAQAESSFVRQNYAAAQSQWATAATAMDAARVSALELARAAAPAEPEKSPKTPPPVDPEAERQLIASTLQRYAAALGSKDLAALKAVWPGLSGREEQALRDEFRNARVIRVQVLEPQIEVSGDTATATARREYVLQMFDGSNPSSKNRMTVTLRKSSGAWVIDRIRF